MSGTTFTIGSVCVAVTCAVFFYPDAPPRQPAPPVAAVKPAPAPATGAALPPLAGKAALAGNLPAAD